ncbi:MAG TPA: hypothetical protein PLA72_11375 [Smithellaceae bacterium]|nr:hypothetical protein [Smithellaceae bacterium]
MAIKNNLYLLETQIKYVSKIIHFMDTLFERVHAGDMKEKHNTADKKKDLRAYNRPPKPSKDHPWKHRWKTWGTTPTVL